MNARRRIPLLAALAAMASLAAAIVLIVMALRGAPVNRAALVVVFIVFGGAISRLLRSRRRSDEA